MVKLTLNNLTFAEYNKNIVFLKSSYLILQCYKKNKNQNTAAW